MEALYRAYKDNDKVAFYFIYINEAHPARGPSRDAGVAEGYLGLGRHRQMDDRILAASKCMRGLGLTMPVLIDNMNGVAEKAYRGRPAATAVIGFDGKIAFYSRGPWGTQPEEAGRVLKQLLAAGSE